MLTCPWERLGRSGHVPVCELLGEYHASPLTMDAKGLNALHYVASRGDADMAAFLGRQVSDDLCFA